MIGHKGSSLIDANIKLPAPRWKWFNTGEQEAAGTRVISNLTLHIPVRTYERPASFMRVLDAERLDVSVSSGMSNTPVFGCLFKLL